ncbi:spindle and kinetochore-associated protein 2 isoform X1 [Rattus norvegicus]|uniref:spindle and kinetochore-associated protein 2 isoform X1 n=1 Tax=Rattus norvegicus TaxID=10116 RepID=UPI0019170068|nr:spindle and kinetochore-associated protein 2 isoform X1 [Rattus norvegicus]
MEAEVDKLELMFQKADSDLDYLQYRLEYEVKINHPHSAGELTLLTEEEKAVTERLKSHVPDVENGILQRNFDGEKISSKEIQRGV